MRRIGFVCGLTVAGLVATGCGDRKRNNEVVDEIVGANEFGVPLSFVRDWKAVEAEHVKLVQKPSIDALGDREYRWIMAQAEMNAAWVEGGLPGFSIGIDPEKETYVFLKVPIGESGGPHFYANGDSLKVALVGGGGTEVQLYRVPGRWSQINVLWLEPTG